MVTRGSGVDGESISKACRELRFSVLVDFGVLDLTKSVLFWDGKW
jgi:hypothetical protein